MTDRPWFERWPERLAWERQALAALGIRYEIDEEVMRAGIIKMHLFPEIDGEEVHLVAIFPDLYPYFRFAIKPDFDLIRSAILI